MLHDLANWFKTVRTLSLKRFFVGGSKNVHSSTGPRSYPASTVALWYWSVGSRRSFLNLADRSRSEDSLGVALASENLCETSPRTGCKSASPDSGTRDGHHFRPT